MNKEICKTARTDERQNSRCVGVPFVTSAKSWSTVYNAEGNTKSIPTETKPDYAVSKLPFRRAPIVERRCFDPSGGGDVHSSHRCNAIAKKEAVISHIMRYFNDWLESRLAVLDRQCGDSTNSIRRNPRYPSNGPDQTEKSKQDSKQNRTNHEASTEPPTLAYNSVSVQSHLLNREINCLKIYSGEAVPNFEDFTFGASTTRNREEDIQDDILPPLKRKKLETETTRKFACPFLKHNQKKYGKWRSCAWSSWPTVHQVK
jgi:hypothetical protein